MGSDTYREPHAAIYCPPLSQPGSPWCAPAGRASTPPSPASLLCFRVHLECALKVDADARPCRLRLFRDGVPPVRLASASHDNEVSAIGGESRALPAGAMFDEKASGVAEREDPVRADVAGEA